MDGGDIASTIIGALGLLGGILGFFMARSAGKKAELAEAGTQIAQERSAKAAEDAARALKQSSAANAEAAAALKRANEIAEETLPSKEPSWEIRQISKSKYVAYNMSPGRGVAHKALVEGVGERLGLIQVDETEPRDVPYGDGIAFYVLRVMGPDAVVRVSHENEAGERVHGDRTIH